VILLFPIHTDSPVRRTPYLNYALIAANVAIFFALDLFGQWTGGWGRPLKMPLMLWPSEPELHQFVTYQFLHGSHWHLLGNMVFLWIFGNSVNAKMGNLAYLFFYVAAGVFAGIGFVMSDVTSPCLGASGSIAGITTAYLVLFPRSEITVFYWLFIAVGTMQVQSLVWIIGKMILWDNYFAMEIKSPYTNVAYEAHLAGYLFGFLMACVMLWIRALPRDQFDILALLRRWHQRRAFAAAVRDPDALARAQYGRVARPVSEAPAQLPAVVEPTGKLAALRREIAEALSRDDYPGAAALYESLIAESPAEVLPRSQQVMLANYYMTAGRHSFAAEAYEKYLKHYPMAPDRAEIRLMLGIAYARYLGRAELARMHLLESLSSLVDADLRSQASHWLEVISAAPPGVPGVDSGPQTA